MEIIEIKEMIDFFKSKIAVIILVMILIGALGSCYGLFLQKPMYKSVTSVILKNDSNQGNSLSANDLTMNKSLVGTYSEVIKSKRILNKVIDNLNLKCSVSNLSGSIQVTSTSNTELIKIIVSNSNNKKAKMIADETAGVFVEEIPKLYSISNVSVLDRAEIAVYPYNINIKKQLALYLIIGLFLGSGIVFVMYYFDRSIKSLEQIDKLGLPILGSVQEY